MPGTVRISTQLAADLTLSVTGYPSGSDEPAFEGVELTSIRNGIYSFENPTAVGMHRLEVYDGDAFVWYAYANLATTGVIEATESPESSSEVIVESLSSAALAQLAGTQINITVPAVAGGRLTQPLVRGDSYSAALGSSLDFSRSDFPDLPEGTTATFTARRISEDADGVPTVNTFVISGEQASIPEPAGVKVVRFEPTAEQTLLWQPGEYEFDVKITFPGGARRTFRGPDIFLTVLDQVTQ